MIKLIIQIQNLLTLARYFMKDKRRRLFLGIFALLYTFFLVSGLLYAIDLAAPPPVLDFSTVNIEKRLTARKTSEQRSAVQAFKEEARVPKSRLFWTEKRPVGLKTPRKKNPPSKPTLDVKIYFTGIGKVRGIYKATLEDSEGRVYYVKEGDKTTLFTVKSLSQSRAVLLDKYGNTIRLRLGR